MGVRTLATAALLALAAQRAAEAATRTWLGGSGTWDDATTANWSGGAVPTNTDTVMLTSDTAASLSIDYTAANLTDPPGLAQLTVGNSGGGTNTLNLDGTDSLPTGQFALNPGGAVNMSGGTLGMTSTPAISSAVLNGGVCSISGGLWRARIPANGSLQVGHAAATGPATLNLQGTGSISIAGSSEQNLTVGGSTNHPAVLNQSGGTMTVPFYVRIYSKGTYNLSSGTLNASRPLQVNSFGTYSQSGGTGSCSYGVSVSGSNATLNLSGGTLYVNSQGLDVTVGSGGTVNYTGGRLLQSAGEAGFRDLYVTGAGASWNMQGTTFTVNRNGQGGVNSVVLSNSTFQGYGTISQASGEGGINNSGRVIANGYGADGTLNFSLSSVANATDNTTSNGWFAVNKGTLLLPPVPVAAGSSTTNWGEAAEDAAIDLVNSVRIDFTGATAGSLTGMLYAADCAAVPAGLEKTVGLWSFGGVTCTAAVVTFRYDNASAAAKNVAEPDLRVWRHNGIKWVDVTASRDDAAKTIVSQSIPTWPKATTFFAVAPPVTPKGLCISLN